MNEKFKALEIKKRQLEKEYWEPFFIDIKKMKLYMIEENGETTYF